MKVAQFKNVLDFTAAIEARNPGNVATIGISLEEKPAYPFTVNFLADEEPTNSYVFDTKRAYIRLAEVGTLSKSVRMLLTVSGQEIRINLQKAEAARHTLNSGYATPAQKKAAQQTLDRFTKIQERILEAGKALSAWLNKGGWSRNIGATPVTSTIQVPLITSIVADAAVELTQSVSRMPVTAFIMTRDVLVFVEDVAGTVIGWNGEEVAPDYRFGLDQKGNILGLVYIQGNLECAVKADNLIHLLDQAEKQATEEGYATMAIVPFSTIVRFSEGAPFKSLGDITKDEKGNLEHEAVTTTEHSLVEAPNLFAPKGYVGRTIKSAQTFDKGEVRVVRTADTLRNEEGTFVALKPNDAHNGSAQICAAPKLAKVSS